MTVIQCSNALPENDFENLFLFSMQLVSQQSRIFPWNVPLRLLSVPNFKGDLPVIPQRMIRNIESPDHVRMLKVP